MSAKQHLIFQEQLRWYLRQFDRCELTDNKTMERLMTGCVNTLSNINQRRIEERIAEQTKELRERSDSRSQTPQN